MSKQHHYDLVAIVIGLLFCSLMVSAQTTTASVAGTVRDETRAVLPGVEITVLNPATGASRTAVSGDSGEYLVTNLPPR